MEGYERAYKVFIVHKDVTKLSVKYNRWSHEVLDLRPLSNTAVEWYSPIWSLGNQAYVYQW